MEPLLTSTQIKRCNGKISSNGYCQKCGMPTQVSSPYCMRYYPFNPDKTSGVSTR